MSTKATYCATTMPRNKGKPVGQKQPPRLQERWENGFELESESWTRNLAMVSLAVDSKRLGIQCASELPT